MLFSDGAIDRYIDRLDRYINKDTHIKIDKQIDR